MIVDVAEFTLYDLLFMMKCFTKRAQTLYKNQIFSTPVSKSEQNVVQPFNR